MKFEHPPLDEEVEATPKQDVALEPALVSLDEHLPELVANVGEREVNEAIAQVTTGKAEPEALLAWIDDVRSLKPRPPNADVHAEDEPAVGFLHDFEADSELAYEDGTEATPAAVAEDAPQAATPPAFFDSDPDYFFSATRRRPGFEDEGDDPDHGGGGGGGGDDGKPKSPPRPPAATRAPASTRPPTSRRR